MEGDILVMRQSELKRLELIKKAISKQLGQLEVSKFVGVSLRQVQRIIKRVREQGDKGVIHQHRGKANCRRIKEVLKAKILRIYSHKYKDFGGQALEDSDFFVDRAAAIRHGFHLIEQVVGEIVIGF